MMSYSLLEEPFSNPPQQTKKPEMSVMEESDFNIIMSARTKPANTSLRSSDRLIHASVEPEQAPTDQTMLSASTTIQ